MKAVRRGVKDEEPSMKEQEMRQSREETSQIAGAAEQVAKSTAQRSAGKTAGQAAEAAVKAGKTAAASGKAASEVVAGTAAGGPMGTILSAGWSMRHTLFKILICICLVLLFFVVTIVATPGILIKNIANVFVSDSKETAVQASYIDLEAIVNFAMQKGYGEAMAEAERIISDGGYDYTLSMEHLTDLSGSTADRDTCYLLAVYTVTAEQNSVSRENLIDRLNRITDRMFPVTYEKREKTVTVTDGEESRTETISYVACTIHAFDRTAMEQAFGLNADAEFGNTGKTCRQIVDFYTESFFLILGLEQEG